jgi:hypothetical protein
MRPSVLERSFGEAVATNIEGKSNRSFDKGAAVRNLLQAPDFTRYRHEIELDHAREMLSANLGADASASQLSSGLKNAFLPCAKPTLRARYPRRLVGSNRQSNCAVERCERWNEIVTRLNRLGASALDHAAKDEFSHNLQFAVDFAKERGWATIKVFLAGAREHFEGCLTEFCHVSCEFREASTLAVKFSDTVAQRRCCGSDGLHSREAHLVKHRYQRDRRDNSRQYCREKPLVAVCPKLNASVGFRHLHGIALDLTSDFGRTPEIEAPGQQAGGDRNSRSDGHAVKGDFELAGALHAHNLPLRHFASKLRSAGVHNPARAA